MMMWFLIPYYMCYFLKLLFFLDSVKSSYISTDSVEVIFQREQKPQSGWILEKGG